MLSLRLKVWFKIISLKVLWLFLKLQVFELFKQKRAFYTKDRQVIFSVFKGLFFIYLAINDFCIVNEVCLNVVIRFSPS